MAGVGRQLFATAAFLALLAAVAGGAPALARDARDQAPTNVDTDPAPRAVFAKYCVSCHNGTRRTADLALDGDLGDIAARPETWEKVIRKLRTEAMPPAGLPRPDKATYRATAAQLEQAIDQAAQRRPDPGRLPPVHRLNRTEYRNAIRDLLAIE
jgi:hypothetical protein